MGFDLAFNSTEIGYFFISLIGVILLITFYFRTKVNNADADLLHSKYENNKIKSLLNGRNKYPDVDLYRFSNLTWMVSLSIALMMVIALMGWTNFERKAEVMSYSLEFEESIEIEPPRTQDPPSPPPPPPPSVTVEAVTEELLEEEKVEFLDQSVDEETLFVPPPKIPEKEEVADAPPPPLPPPPVEETDMVEIFKIVEEMPSFPGCEDVADKKERRACSDKKLYEYIFSHIQYPPIARENGIEGMVYIQFVVETDGSISNAKIVRDVGAGLGEEALRVVNKMNDMPRKWNPGQQRTKKVRVFFTLPIKFQLLT